MFTPAPLQTTYIQYEPVMHAGQVITQATYEVDTRIADDPLAVGIGFGLAVSQGYVHGDKSAVLGQESGGVFVGITVASVNLPNLTGETGMFTDMYADGENMDVLSLGDIAVLPATNVAVGTEAYFNSVTGQLGSSSIANAVAIPGSSWRTSLPRPSGELETYNGLAIVRLGVMV